MLFLFLGSMFHLSRCGLMTDGSEVDEVSFESLIDERILGLGSLPQNIQQDLEASYRDEQQFRVIL